MAITTQAGLIAGLQQPIIWSKGPPAIPGGASRLVSTWQQAGFTSVGTYPNTMAGVTCDKTTTGAWTFIDPASGNTYLARFSASGMTPGIGYIILCDRLWHNSGTTSGTPNIDVTVVGTPQTLTSPTWPARDIGGNTTGDGVLLLVECTATMGAGTPNVIISYTNSAGVAGQQANSVTAGITAAPQGNVILMALQAGDTGVRSVQSITLSSTWSSGGLSIVAYRPIGIFEFNAGSLCQLDALNMNMPRLYNGTCLFSLMSMASNSVSGMSGVIQFAQG